VSLCCSVPCGLRSSVCNCGLLRKDRKCLCVAAAVLLKIQSTLDKRVVSTLEGMPKIRSKVDRWIVSTAFVGRCWCSPMWNSFAGATPVSSDRRGRPLGSWLSGFRARWCW
jgi:hypothetical protein